MAWVVLGQSVVSHSASLAGIAIQAYFIPGKIMKRLIVAATIGLTTGACLLAGSTASAAPIGYGSFSGNVIDFDGLAGSATLGGGEVLSNQFSGLGVTFAVPNFNAFASTSIAGTSSLNSDPNVIWVDQAGGSGGASAMGMTINFSTPQSKVGLLLLGSLSSTFTVEAYNGGTLLESLTSTLAAGGVGLEGFLALADANITKVIVYSTNSSGQNWNFSIDDLKFDTSAAVPEPGSLLLLGTGLAAILGRRRSKART